MLTIYTKEKIENAQYMRQMMIIVAIIIVCYVKNYIQKIEPEK